MSQINSVGNNVPVQQIRSAPISRPAAGPTGATLTDKLELSGMSHPLKSTDKVAAIRAQLEAGIYENDKKLDVAIDRLLDDLVK